VRFPAKRLRRKRSEEVATNAQLGDEPSRTAAARDSVNAPREKVVYGWLSDTLENRMKENR
jgi:hypothetical protein